MADYNSTHTGALIDTTITNADAGNIGKGAPVSFEGDANTLVNSGFYNTGVSATNLPVAAVAGRLTVIASSSSDTTQIYSRGTQDLIYFRRQSGGAWQPWQELYHTGNTGFTEYTSGAPSAGADTVRFRTDVPQTDYSSAGTASTQLLTFRNDNGAVGSIATSGTTTAYNVSSDPRLKDFKGKPSDGAIDAQFNLLFGAFDTFNWKNEPQGPLVWGFNAHTAIDNGLDMGTEGEGPRTSNLGDVYEQAVIDSEGNETSPAKVVSPAGVDQSKAVPILLAKIEQLERKLKEAGVI